MSLVLAAAAAVLFGLGTWLVLQRRLVRIVIGLGLLGHGANLVLLQSGLVRGAPPVLGEDGGARLADPMPQALALTAIVIAFGATAFLLALAHRSWQITGEDLVEHDLEDRRIAEARAGDDEEVDDEARLHAEGTQVDAGGYATDEAT